MKKIINIDGRDVALQVDGSFLIRYKMKFKRDAMIDMLEIANAASTLTDEELDALSNSDSDGKIENMAKVINIAKCIDAELFYSLFYMMAKSGNPQVPDDMLEYLSSFEDLPIVNLIGPILELVTSSLISDKALKKTLDHQMKQ